MENMATAEAAEMAAEGEAIVDAEAVKTRSGGRGKQKKGSKDSKSGNNTACPDRYFCLESHKASECPNRSASATAPATSNSQHGRYFGSVRTNLGAGLLIATSARPALATRGAPHERHEDEYWMADSGATQKMTQNSSYLEDYTPVSAGDEVESAGGAFLSVAANGCLRLLVDQDKGTFKGAMGQLTLDRAAHVPKLERHNLFSTNDSQQRSTRRCTSTQSPPPFDPVSAAKCSFFALYAQTSSKSRSAVASI